MRNDEFDRLMKQALEERAQDVAASPFLLEKIKNEAEQRSGKERFSMKGFHMKKIAVAAVICLASVTCYAAVNFGGAVAHSNNNVETFADMKKAEKEAGFDAKYVERFGNGFAFSRGGAGENQGMDEEGNPMGEIYGMLTVSYENKDGENVTLIVEDGNPYVDAGQEAEEGYSAQQYKFVPPDYQLTEEDKAKEASGELLISYGSLEVEEKTMENYSWQEDGLYYSLIAANCDLGEDALAQMAEEIKG